MFLRMRRALLYSIKWDNPEQHEFQNDFRIETDRKDRLCKFMQIKWSGHNYIHVSGFL